MRITGGTLSGIAVPVPPGPVRPTQDRIREAVFSSLAPGLPGARVVDLFAGAGAMGLEAWSRGAARVCWVESHPRVFQHLRETVRRLCPGGEGGETQVRRAGALEFLRRTESATPYDLILADPPYARAGEAGWLGRVTEAVAEGSVLRPGGMLVFECGRRESPDPPPGWEVRRDRTYGDTRVLMLVTTLTESRSP